MMNSTFLIYLISINVGTFMLYGFDKYKAIKHVYRTPEITLLWCAALGGSIGALCGMYFFHHKTQKPKFAYGVPLILLIQIIVLFFFIIKK